MSEKGVKIAALYSCKEDITDLLKKVDQGKERIEKLEQALRKLPNIIWYKLLAKFSGIEDIFDEKIGRAYWTGNKLTKPISGKGSKIFPFHNFVILNNPDIKKADNCKISTSRIKKVGEATLIVYHLSLVRSGNKILLARKSEEKMIKKGFVDHVTQGMWISYHFNIAREVLKEKEALALIRRTEKAIEFFNEQQR